MKINKKLFTELLKSTVKEGETITKPTPVKPGTTPTPGKKPNPLMPPKEAPDTKPKGKLKEENIFDKVSQRYEKLKESADPSTSLFSLFEQIVSEASIEQLKQQFVDTEKISPEVFDAIVKATNGKGAYATWMIKRVEDETIKDEDIYKYEDYLKFFDKFKREFPSPDINAYKDERSIRDFEQKAIQLRERGIEQTGGDVNNASNLVPPKGIQELNEVGIKFIGTVDGYQCFLIPNSAKGNTKAWETYRKYLANCSGRDQGAKIEICTMASQGHFDRYLTEYGGDYYVFFNLGDPKSPYQFHYESNQFMDKNDHALI
jgi:hypothetical protein